MKLFIIITLGFLIGCRDSNPTKVYHTLKCGPFTMETPKTWIVQMGYGTFSAAVGNIIIDNQDTLSFDISWFANSLTETDSVIIEENTGLINKAKPDTSNIDLDKFRKNNISWDTIDGQEAKIIYPRKSGIGTTGIYFKRIADNGNGLTLSGENLNPENEKLLLQALKTIKFYRKK